MAAQKLQNVDSISDNLLQGFATHSSVLRMSFNKFN